MEETTERLIGLEAGKWNPASLAGGVASLAGLFAPDFVSVEYGSDFSGGVVRRTLPELLAGPPLPPASFELSEWRAIRPSDDVVVLSYRVEGKSFAWKAYAASVWANRGGEWRTVFYQASKAR